MSGADLPQHADQGAAAQRFLHDPEHLDVGAAMDKEQPSRIEPERRQAGPIKAASAPAPQRQMWFSLARAAARFDQPSQQDGAESASGDAVVGGDDLVNASARQAAPGQGVVEGLDTGGKQEGQGRRLSRAACAKVTNAGVQFGDQRRIGPSKSLMFRHWQYRMVKFMKNMFMKCSNLNPFGASSRAIP